MTNTRNAFGTGERLHAHDLLAGAALHRPIIGRTRGVRGPDAMERAMAGIVVVVVVIMAMWFGVHAQRMAKTLDAVSLASGVETDAILYRAAHGRWPAAAATRVNGDYGHYVRAMYVRGDGVVIAQLAWQRQGWPWDASSDSAAPVAKGAQYLSFRPELLGAPGAAAVLYRCGYAQPVDDARSAAGTNKTNIDKADLPPFCR